MAAEKKKNTGLLLGGLVAAYLLLRDQSPQQEGAPSSGMVPTGGNAPAPGASSAPASSGGGIISTAKNVITDVKTGAGIVTSVASATGLAAPFVVAALATEAAGGYIGYQLDGTRGAVAGILNPVIGDSVEVGAKIGDDLANAVGLNKAGTAASSGSGAVLGGIVALADLATAAALLPTVGIVIGLAELLGAVFGLGGSDAPPPNANDQVQAAYQVAAALVQLPPPFNTPRERIQAAAQIVAWANGPDMEAIAVPGTGLTAQIVNPYKAPARIAAAKLGLDSLIKH